MGKRVKFIMESPHFTTLHRSETSSIAERDVRGVAKKVLQQYCYGQDWMISGGPILWNIIAICENVQDLLGDGEDAT